MTRFTRQPPREGLAEAAEIKLTFEDNRLASLVFGQYDQNIAHLERRLGIFVNLPFGALDRMSLQRSVDDIAR